MKRTRGWSSDASRATLAPVMKPPPRRGHSYHHRYFPGRTLLWRFMADRRENLLGRLHTADGLNFGGVGRKVAAPPRRNAPVGA